MSYPTNRLLGTLKTEDVPQSVRNSTESLRLSGKSMGDALAKSSPDITSLTARAIALWVGRQVAKAFLDEYLRRRDSAAASDDTDTAEQARAEAY